MSIGPVIGILNVGEFLDGRNPVHEILLEPVRLVVVGHGAQGDDGHQQGRAEGSSETCEERLEMEISPFCGHKMLWPMQTLCIATFPRAGAGFTGEVVRFFQVPTGLPDKSR